MNLNLSMALSRKAQSPAYLLWLFLREVWNCQPYWLPRIYRYRRRVGSFLPKMFRWGLRWELNRMVAHWRIECVDLVSATALVFRTGCVPEKPRHYCRFSLPRFQ